MVKYGSNQKIVEYVCMNCYIVVKGLSTEGPLVPCWRCGKFQFKLRG